MIKGLFYIWRLAATCLCFGSFAFGGILLTLIGVPLLHLLPGGKEALQRRTRYIIHKSFSLIIRTAHSSGILHLETRGEEALLTSKNTLVLANHPSYVDIVVLLSRVSNADCVVKSEHWSNPVFGGAMRAAGYVRNDSPESLIEQCSERIMMGGTLIIFPEGSRTRPNSPLRFLRGSAHIALESNANILPVIMRCDPPTWTKAQRWYDIPKERIRIQMDIKNISMLKSWVADEEDSPLAARRLTRALERYFTEELAIHENNSTRD